MKRNILKISLVLVAILLAFGIMSSSSYAYTMSINGGEKVEVPTEPGKAAEPIVLTEEVSTIEIESTIEELVDILNAYNLNAGYKFTEYASNATIVAKITNMFSTEGITQLSTVAPEGVKIEITPGVKDIVYTSSSFEMPEGFEIDFTDSIIHLPETTTVTEALKIFEDIGVAEIVACGENYNITVEGENNTTTVHLNKGEDLKAMFDLVEQEQLDNIIVAAPDYHINLTGEEDIVWLAGDLTEEEVLELVKDLRVDATVRVVENDTFSVELSVDKEPVVNRTEEPKDDEVVAPEEEKDETPHTGVSNYVGIVATVVVVSIIALAILKRKNV